MTWTLVVAGSVSLAAAAAYAFAATRFVGRGSGADRDAARAFALWWSAIALYTGAQGALDLAAAAGWAPFPLFVAWRFASLVVYCVGLAGLSMYVLYVRTGNALWPRVVAAYYAVLTVALVALAAQSRPSHVVVHAWRTDVAFASPTTGPALASILLLILVPVLVATLAYLRFRSRTTDARAKRRILIVGSSIATWLAASALSRASENDAFQLVARPILGALVATAVVLAFRPERPTPAAGASRSAGREALQRRVRDLV